MAKQPPSQSLEEELDQDYEALDETAEEWPEDTSEPEPLSEADRIALEKEIADLEGFRNLACRLRITLKVKRFSLRLIARLPMLSVWARRAKAIIFTESRRTQEYLLRVLANSVHADRIVLFNGSNTDACSRQIYTQWLQRHEGTRSCHGFPYR